MAEIVLEKGAMPDAFQIDQALAARGFQLVNLEKTADGKILCQISGLQGSCCVPGVEACLRNSPGVKVVKVKY